MTNYQPGSGGVNLVKSPLQLADNELTKAQNAEYNPDVDGGGQGALTKRGGLQKLFSSALNGAVYGMIATGLEPPPAPSLWFPESQSSISEDTSTVGNEITIEGGAATSVAALSDDSDLTFVRHKFAIGEASGFHGQDFALAAFTDPGVDTGFTLVYRCRQSHDVGEAGTDKCSLYVYLATATSSTVIVEVTELTTSSTGHSHAAPTGEDFVDVEFPLTAAQVQAIRADGGFAEGGLVVTVAEEVDAEDGQVGITEDVTFDFARVYIRHQGQ